MPSRAAQAHAVDVSRDPTRMLTKFELPRPSAEPPPPLESGTHAIDRTAIMRSYESAKLRAASLPTPSEPIAPAPAPVIARSAAAPMPVPAPTPTEEDAPSSDAFRTSELPTMPGLPALPLPRIAELAPLPAAPAPAAAAATATAGLWQALALSVVLSAALGIGAKVIGVLLF